jgi:hypothetical protein
MARHFCDNHNTMIYVIYVFGGLFIVLSVTMLYVFYRNHHFGLFLMGITYGSSGLIAIALPDWWPLLLGFALVWVLRMLGLEPRVVQEDSPRGTDAAGETRKD